MRNWLFILFSFVAINTVFGQSPKLSTPVQQPATGDRLNLVSSNSGKINAKTGHMIFYKPVYEHKGSTLSADSGYLYEDEVKRQFFEAFGNVVITQPSGTMIYANRLHYDAAAQHARLTGNVKLVDGASVLTTNYLTYNMRSKVGTYTGGGRIVSQGDTITSKNAYYFENTADAYFRHKVVVRNANVKVYTDSMRYNSLTKMTYFFGPTNIKGNNKENLYTERGTYNTASGIANFNKNNLYSEGSRFLKGDSLHYERVTGIGEAFKNVVFVDTTDKFYAYGNKGVYRQDEESILMTEKPYIITVVKNDSKDSATENEVPKVTMTEKKTSKKDKKASEKAEVKLGQKAPSSAENIKETKDSIPTPPAPAVDSVYMTADTLYSRMILAKDYTPLQLNLNRDGGQLISEEEVDYGDDEMNSDSLGTDSIFTKEDISNLKTVKKAETAVKTKAAPKKTVVSAKSTVLPKGNNDIYGIEQSLKADSIIRQKAVIPIANQADSMINKALKTAQEPTITKNNKTDSLNKAQLDTARTRIVKAFYNVRLFKSDLQAVADSVYYGMQDSMFRFMGRPMIWAQGSQISADTIFMQILNQQMDNALLKNNAFMVNAVLDTVKFNQLKGRKITAFFSNNNIERLFVDGNAENLIFVTNEETKIITEMFHDRGARIKINLENKKITDYKTYLKVDQKVYPFRLVTQENEMLPGFIWRPQDRPTSKEDLLNRKRELHTENLEEKTKNTESSPITTEKDDEQKTEIKKISNTNSPSKSK